ncbi:MAG TPA: glycosyl hydrolase, partial [Lacipirellulaceae bacterium]|nr:glycosyl hydrolase [Lacipirellulaceae bacterium]
HNCPGYESSGGPWITPELSMQEIVWSEKPVAGGATVQTRLPRPQPDLRAVQPYPVYNPTTNRLEKPEIPARREFYRDIAVLALPAEGPVAKYQVIDLTARMGSDGQLAWEAPPGKWIVYRFGHTTMGKLLQPGQWEAIGLECDKMSRAAVQFHLDHIIGEARRHLGELVGAGLNFYHFDSYEAGVPTWTPLMPQEFRDRRGYSLVAYLPTFANRVIGDSSEVEKFRADFQQTIRDLYRENYFPVIAQRLHAARLEFMCEPYGGPWATQEVVPHVDRIVTEYWTHGGKYNPFELVPTVAAVRAAGRNLIEAEAFTGSPAESQWSETPYWLKSIGDAAFCDGVNRLCLHRFTHQPLDERFRPGVVMGQWGTHFDRTQTWWEPGKSWVTYLARCQALLQWGAIVSQDGDFQVVDPQGQVEIRAIHRRAAEADVYFVANVARSAGAATCTFAVSGRHPELWDPVHGTLRDIDNFSVVPGRSTSIPLEFADSQSVFVVFRKPLESKTGERPSVDGPGAETAAEIEGPWTVQFDPAWGGPGEVVFAKLDDWSHRPEPGIRFYSGSAAYQTKFAAPAELPPATRVWLDLGAVRDLAAVRLNGHDLGVVWTAPWRVDVTDSLQSGDNELQITVTNTWANRLIGDEQEAPDVEWGKGDHGFGGPLKAYPSWLFDGTPRPSSRRVAFTTWNYFHKNSPLMPAGLLGPVRICVEGEHR